MNRAIQKTQKCWNFEASLKIASELKIVLKNSLLRQGSWNRLINESETVYLTNY